MQSILVSLPKGIGIVVLEVPMIITVIFFENNRQCTTKSSFSAPQSHCEKVFFTTAI